LAGRDRSRGARGGANLRRALRAHVGARARAPSTRSNAPMSPPSALFIYAASEATAEAARQPALDCTTPDYSYCHPAMATLRAFDDATISCVYRDRLRDEDGRRYAADPPARPARVLVGRELLPWESAGRAFYLLLYALYCAENPAAWGEIQRHMSFVDETGLYAVTDPLDPWPITGAAALALLARGEPLAPSMAPLFERASGLRALPRLETVAAARTMGETAARGRGARGACRSRDRDGRAWTAVRHPGAGRRRGDRRARPLGGTDDRRIRRAGERQEHDHQGHY